MSARRRQQHEAPPEMPDGFTLFYRRVVPIADVEAYAEQMMRGFDDLPRMTRFALNCAPQYPRSAAKLVRQFGDAEASRKILKSNWTHVFKTRDRTGAHP